MNQVRRRGWYHGWNIVAGSILTTIALMSLALNSFSLFLADWARELGSPISTLQLAITGFGIACAVVSPIAGTLVDRWPGRRLFVLGFAILALVELGIGSATATWQLLAIYIVALPLANMILSLATVATVMRWFVRRRGLAIALTSTGLALSGILVPPIVATILPDIGWRAVWQIGAGAIALVVGPVVVLLMRPRPDHRDNPYYTSSDAVAASDEAEKLETLFRWGDVLRGKTFWIVVATCLALLSLYGAVTQNMAPIAASKGLDGRIAGGLLSIVFASQLLFTLLAGVLSDRVGNRLPLAAFALATATGAVIVMIAGDVFAMAAGVALIGLGCAYFPLLTSVIAGSCAPGGFGRTYGLATGILCFAGFAPFYVAKTREITGAYDAALLTLAAAGVVAGVLCAIFLRDRGTGKGSAPQILQSA